MRNIYTKVGRSEAVTCRRDGRCGRVSEVCVDVSEQITHYTRYVSTHVLGRQAREMSVTDTQEYQ